MAEYFITQGGLMIESHYSNTLDMEGFSQMMKDPSACYKFYWLEAIVKLISEDKDVVSFDDVINEMIVNAWYTVREYHIHLTGKTMGEWRDALEKTVNRLGEISSLSSGASKVEILNAIREHVKDSDFRSGKVQLTMMVPYYALSGFFDHADEAAPYGNKTRMVSYIQKIHNSSIRLPYTLDGQSGLNRQVIFDPEWKKMIQENTVAILGWIQNEKLKWLQNINPEVPGLVYKLAPTDEKIRRLNAVHKLWDGILDLSPVRDVFTEAIVQKNKYEVDHFIPWSFVMNDELWNLMPMEASLNSSKSNRLPEWEPFFRRFSDNQYLLYSMITGNDHIHTLFNGCYKDNLHSIWAEQELYGKGNSKEKFFRILEENMHPVWESARRQGYEIWRR